MLAEFDGVEAREVQVVQVVGDIRIGVAVDEPEALHQLLLRAEGLDDAEPRVRLHALEDFAQGLSEGSLLPSRRMQRAQLPLKPGDQRAEVLQRAQGKPGTPVAHVDVEAAGVVDFDDEICHDEPDDLADLGPGGSAVVEHRSL